MSDFWKKIRSNRFINNTNWLIFQNIYSMGLSLVVGALSARYLGPSNYGLIGYGASLVNLFTAISQLGIDNVLINEMMKHPEEKGRVMGTALCMRACSATVSLVCAMILVILIEPGNHVLWFITGIQAFAIALRAYELLNEWFLSEMKSKYYVMANICGQTVVGIWKIVLLILQASVVWFAASTTVQAFVCGGIVITIFLLTRDFRLGFCRQYARDIFGRSKHYVLAGGDCVIHTDGQGDARKDDGREGGGLLYSGDDHCDAVGVYPSGDHQFFKSRDSGEEKEERSRILGKAAAFIVCDQRTGHPGGGSSADLWRPGGTYPVWKGVYGCGSGTEAADLVHDVCNDRCGEKYMECGRRQKPVFEALYNMRRNL